MAAITTKLQHAWNAFKSNEDNTFQSTFNVGPSSGSSRPDRPRLMISNERSIVSAIYNRMAMDFAAVVIRHVRLDGQERYKETLKTDLNNCLTVEANVDQAAQAFKHDLAMSLFEEGYIAIVPIDTTLDPTKTGGYDIQTMRVGKIVEWLPRHVRVNVYDDRPGKGTHKDVVLEKKHVAVVPNPFYAVMNERSSTLQRLIRKLNLLDTIDEQSGSGKLDLIIQLPYVIKSETRKAQALQRREDIEFQLKNSKYGIAYAEATEKITQLNRPAENNLMAQIEYLVSMLYGQLGLTPEILNGTADEKTMINYHNRTIKPLLVAVTEAMSRSFITKTGRSQGQAIKFFRDPFELTSVSTMAEVADKFTRNEIMTSNEIRSFMGIMPSTDPKADELRNSNMPAPSESAPTEETNQEGE